MFWESVSDSFINFLRTIKCKHFVIACTHGTYGVNCSDSCGACKANMCDHITGTCPGECAFGFYGEMCKECKHWIHVYLCGVFLFVLRKLQKIIYFCTWYAVWTASQKTLWHISQHWHLSSSPALAAPLCLTVLLSLLLLPPPVLKPPRHYRHTHYY